MSLLDDIRERANRVQVPPREDVLQPPDKPPSSTIEQLEKLLESFPAIGERTSIRIEVSIKDELERLCQQEKITIEILLESLYTVCKDKESLMKQVLKEANKRIKSRKEAGNIRYNLTRLGKLKV
jgi:predicted DNA-binding ribbon-helix-helix protein